MVTNIDTRGFHLSTCRRECGANRLEGSWCPRPASQSVFAVLLRSTENTSRTWVTLLLLNRSWAWRARIHSQWHATSCDSEATSARSCRDKATRRRPNVFVEAPEDPCLHVRTAGGRSQSPPARAPMAGTRAFWHSRASLELVSSA